METVGIYLKKEREAKNISLSEVSRQTKISKFYLNFIENDDYDKLPQGPYIKGYISSYSKLIGSDVQEALKLYDSLNDKVNQVDTAQSGLPKPKNVGTPSPKTEMNRTGHSTATLALAGKIGSSYNSAASTIKFRIASVKAATLSLNKAALPVKKIFAWLTRGSSKLIAMAVRAGSTAGSKLKATVASVSTIGLWIQTKTGALKTAGRLLKNAVSTVIVNRRLSDRRYWLAACTATLGACILVLAGFGVYHLFIFDKNPPVITEIQSPPGEKQLPSTTLEALSSPTKTALKKEKLTSDTRHTSAASVAKPTADTPHKSPAILVENEAENQLAAVRDRGVTESEIELVANLPPAEPAMAAVNLSVLKASISTDVENRMPVGVDTVFSSSVQRIYVWSQIEARQFPSKIRHIYYFKDWKINDVTLDVRSSNWRTWSFKTISSDRYRGPWRVDITSAGGKILRRLHFDIK